MRMLTCPFCRSINVELKTAKGFSSHSEKIFVGCNECDAKGPSQINYVDADDDEIEETENKAVELWNTRS